MTKGDYIELYQLLKAVNIASSGADAKSMIDEGLVELNGTPEHRRRAKVRIGDRIKVGKQTISIK